MKRPLATSLLISFFGTMVIMILLFEADVIQHMALWQAVLVGAVWGLIASFFGSALTKKQ